MNTTTTEHIDATVPNGIGMLPVKGVPQVFSLTAQPAKVAKLLFLVVAILLMAHIGGYVVHSYFPDRELGKIARHRFGMGYDANIPTIFSVMLLFAAAALLYVLYRRELATGHKQAGRYWLVLSGIFVFLGFDEGAKLHELLGPFIDSRVGTKMPTLLEYAWVIPYGLGALAVAVYFFRFLMRLPARTRNLIMLSGVIYVGGALGMEMLEGAEKVRISNTTTLYVLMQTIEEVMEMSGIVLFIYALLSYMRPGRLQLSTMA